MTSEARGNHGKHLTDGDTVTWTKRLLPSLEAVKTIYYAFSDTAMLTRRALIMIPILPRVSANKQNNDLL